MKKIIDLGKLSKVVGQIQKVGENIVLVGGCFDILHLGHVTFLEKARKKGDFLIVLLESDQVIRTKKGDKRPINSQKNRAKVLSALKDVDLIVMLPEMKNEDYDKVVKEIKPSIIAITSKDPEIKYKKRSAKLIGAKISIVTKFIPEHSTTAFLNIIEEN